MGTRADFYVDRDETAQWIGSIAWDGYRSGIDDAVLHAHSEAEFRAALAAFFADDRDDVTTPEMGWPWPWETSKTTDCSYWFFAGKVWDVRIRDGCDVYVPCDEQELGEDAPGYDKWIADRERVQYPDMSRLKNVTLGKRSGLMVIGPRGPE